VAWAMAWPEERNVCPQKPVNNLNQHNPSRIYTHTHHRATECNKIKHNSVHINIQTTTSTLAIKHIYTVYINVLYM
jgi:hypothetical protein